RLAHRAEQRHGAPFPEADAELAAVAQLRAAREEVRDRVQPVGDQLADLSHRRKAFRLRRAAGGQMKRIEKKVFWQSAGPGASPHPAPGRKLSRKTSSSAGGASTPNTGSGN